MKSEGPDSGAAGYAWFDDVGLVEWEPWQSFSGPADIVIPGDFYWVQLRANTSTQSGQLNYEETAYEPLVRMAEPAARLPTASDLSVGPNPFSQRVLISYSLPGPAHTQLSITNALGQSVRILVNSRQPPGRRTATWDRRDNAGRTLASGVYFCRLQVGNAVRSQKLVLVP